MFSDNLDSKLYAKIVKENVPASADLVLPDGEQRFFLQDNAPTHKSDKVKEVLHNAGITALDFPPYSPDLNPIENLWSILQRRVEKQTAETIEELQDLVVDEWNNIEQKQLQELASSMPRRCAAVVAANGWHTKY